MDPKDRKQSWTIWYVVIAFLAVSALQQLWTTMSQTEMMPYSQFEQLVSAKQVSDVVISADTIQGTLKTPLPDGKSQFATVRVDPAIADKLEAAGVKVTGAPPSGVLGTILSWVLPAIVFYLLWTYLFRGMAEKQGLGGMMAIGKSHAKVYVETDTKVTFKDVAGVEEGQIRAAGDRRRS